MQEVKDNNKEMKEGLDGESKYQSILLDCLEAIKKGISSKHNKGFYNNVKAAIGD
jgi:hypothetical protein